MLSFCLIFNAFPSPNDPRALIEATKSFSVDLYHALPSTIFSSSFGVFSFGIQCNECGTSGSLEISGHVEPNLVGFSEFKVSVFPHGIQAHLALRLIESGELPVGGWEKDFDILSVGIPGFPFRIFWKWVQTFKLTVDSLYPHSKAPFQLRLELQPPFRIHHLHKLISHQRRSWISMAGSLLSPRLLSNSMARSMPTLNFSYSCQLLLV
jgi:hypothetical protein